MHLAGQWRGDRLNNYGTTEPQQNYTDSADLNGFGGYYNSFWGELRNDGSARLTVVAVNQRISVVSAESV
jgi:hypothetical protein